MRLYEPLPREINGEPIDTSFDTVLLVMEALVSSMPDEYKIDTAYQLLAVKPRAISLEEKITFVNEATLLLIGEKPGKEPPDKILDFNQDADAIYASFRQAYGIDLTAERGRLDWRKFIALLSGLPQQTLMAQIIQIRTAEIPPINKYNRKDVQRLIELKARYKLERTDKERVNAIQAFAARQWAVLEGMVKRNV